MVVNLDSPGKLGWRPFGQPKARDPDKDGIFSASANDKFLILGSTKLVPGQKRPSFAGGLGRISTSKWLTKKPFVVHIKKHPSKNPLAVVDFSSSNQNIQTCIDGFFNDGGWSPQKKWSELKDLCRFTTLVGRDSQSIVTIPHSTTSSCHQLTTFQKPLQYPYPSLSDLSFY